MKCEYHIFFDAPVGTARPRVAGAGPIAFARTSEGAVPVGAALEGGGRLGAATAALGGRRIM